MKLKIKEGFTLIEVILSMVLLSIISISILPMSINAVKFAKWNNIRQNAMSMAYTQIEWVKTLDYYTELELKGRYFPPDKYGVIEEGKVEEKLFMNETNSNPKTLDGIEYKFLTNIYWEDGASSTGEYVPIALRKVDVTVIATDPFSGIEKEYSVLGTLIAFEGERKIDKTVPFKITAFKGHGFTEPTKNVKVEVFNEDFTTLKKWGRTDEKGEAVITGLSNEKYRIIGTSWLAGEMMSRPTGTKLEKSRTHWRYDELVELKEPTEVDPYVNHSIFVDYPGYIKLHNVDNNIMENNELILKPEYNPIEGSNLDLNLNTNLKDLENLKIWRNWDYKYYLNHNSIEYKLVQVGTNNLWDGSFKYDEKGISLNNLTLGYLLGSINENENIYEQINSELYLHISYPETLIEEDIKISIKDEKFSLYDENTEILYNLIEIQKPDQGLNKYIIKVNTNYKIQEGKTIKFYLNESITDINGVDIVYDLRYVTLKQK